MGKRCVCMARKCFLSNSPLILELGSRYSRSCKGCFFQSLFKSWTVFLHQWHPAVRDLKNELILASFKSFSCFRFGCFVQVETRSIIFLHNALLPIRVERAEWCAAFAVFRALLWLNHFLTNPSEKWREFNSLIGAFPPHSFPLLDHQNQKGNAPIFWALRASFPLFAEHMCQ